MLGSLGLLQVRRKANAPWKVSISLRNQSSHEPLNSRALSSGKAASSYMILLWANCARSMRSTKEPENKTLSQLRGRRGREDKSETDGR